MKEKLRQVRNAICVNPLRPSCESYSDLAEIFSMTSFNFLFILILYFDFLSRTDKKVINNIVFFENFITVQFSKFLFI
jgi:hypothetical protein